MYSYYLITFNFFSSSSAQSFLLGEKIYTEFRTVFWRFFLVFLYFLFVVGRHVRRWIGAPFCLGSCLVRRTEKLIQFTFFCFVPSPTKPASCSCPWSSVLGEVRQTHPGQDWQSCHSVHSTPAPRDWTAERSQQRALINEKPSTQKHVVDIANAVLRRLVLGL